MGAPPGRTIGGSAGRARPILGIAAVLLVSIALRPAGQEPLPSGIAALRAGDVAAAVTALERAVELAPRDVEAWFWLGVARLEAGNAEDAAEALLRADQLVPELDARITYQLGVALMRAGARGGARARFEALLARDPTAMLPRLNLGWMLLQEDRGAAALELFEAVIADHPDEASAHYWAGVVHQGNARFDDARAAYGRALELAPELLPALLALGDLEMARGELDAARRLFQRAAGAAPAAAAPVARLGVLELHDGDSAAAIAALERALTLDPGDPTARYNLGLAYARAGRGDEAEAALARFDRDLAVASAAERAARREQARSRDELLREVGREHLDAGRATGVVTVPEQADAFATEPEGPGSPGTTTPDELPRFADVTAASGIEFRHHPGGSGGKQLPETMGAGLAWLDYDLDGRQDLYLVDSGTLPASLDAAPPAPWSGEGDRPAGANALYRGADRVRAAFGIARAAGVADRGYGQGASAADYDGDGFVDLYVTNLGRNVLYRNNGDGTFTDVTEQAGVGGERWSVSSAWADLDGDALPELYVVNYLDYDLADPLACGEPDRGVRSYCHISLFDGVGDVLYHNLGNGRFADISAAAGVDNAADGKGLGVVIGHVDDDDLPDIYVANDTAQNFLYLNRGDLRFEDVGLVSGAGYGADGRPQAGMGVELGDIDGDGAAELIVTNFDAEPVNVYRAEAPGFFLDASYPLGVGRPTYPTLGFGVALEDLDADGDLDLVIANGHILDDVERVKDNATWPQPNQLLVNRLTELRQGQPQGPRPESDLFLDATASAGEALSAPRVSRGLAAADFDGDGLLDLAVSNNSDTAQLLRNATTGAGRRLALRLAGRGSVRDAAGARVRVRSVMADAEGSRRSGPDGAEGGGRVPFLRADAGDSRVPMHPEAAEGASGGASTFQLRRGSSYASQHGSDILVGLGAAGLADVEITWPAGVEEILDGLEAGYLYLVIEGRGVVARRALAGG